MLVQRSSIGLTGLVSLFAVLAFAAPAAATVEKKGEWPAEDKKVTLSLDDIDQEDALEKLAEEAGWSIVIKGMGDEKATLHVKDQPAEKVLNVLLAEGDWIARRDGTLISISRNPNPKPAPEVVAVPPAPPVPAVPPPPAIEAKTDMTKDVRPEAKAQAAVHEDDDKGPHKGDGKDREVFGQNLIIDKDELVRNVQLVGGSLVIKGTVTGDVELVGGKLELAPGSRVMGDIQVMGGSVEVKNGARIDGDTHIVGGHMQREEGALVQGNVSTRIKDDNEQGSLGARFARELGESTTAGAFLFALGAVLIALFTKRSEMIKVEFAARPMRMFALGVAGFFGGLLTLCALCVTLVGIPFAAIGILLATLAIFAAMTSVLEVVGRGLIGHKTTNEYAHLAFGCALFAAAMMIPVVDDIAKIVLMLVSIGSLVSTRGAGLIPPRKNGQTMSDAHPYRSAEAV